MCLFSEFKDKAGNVLLTTHFLPLSSLSSEASTVHQAYDAQPGAISGTSSVDDIIRPIVSSSTNLSSRPLKPQ